jgi:2-oxoglutarate dehydrogenase E2 component (dihydrolipoamide succinyltransferase)
MAIQKIVMPQMGESITNGTITKWHKKPGDKIKIDEILLEISTDKVESEIPSPFEGRVEALHGAEGDTIDVGILIAEIQDDPSAAFAGAAQSNTPRPSSQPSAGATVAITASSPAVIAHSETDSDSEKFYTPLVKAMAKDHGVSLSELDQLKGSGAGGRVNKHDFLSYLENRGAKTSPSVQSPVATSTKTTAVEMPTYQHGERIEVVMMDNMRKAIAKNMILSKQVSAHVNSISEVDLSHLVKFRESIKHDFKKQEGFNLTYTHFIAMALIHTLRKFPKVNASIDGDKILIKKDINLGIAVAVPGNGLVVPVIHGADNFNMIGLCRRINELAEKARTKKLTMDDLQGGTFTFTNVGSFGTLFATPVILQPQLGIYASGAIQKRVVVLKDDAIAVRSMMYGTHTYDHRVIDGEMGGNFLEAVHQYLRETDPASLF